MEQKTTPESVVREIKRRTRRKFGAEEKTGGVDQIQIAFGDLRTQDSALMYMIDLVCECHSHP